LTGLIALGHADRVEKIEILINPSYVPSRATSPDSVVRSVMTKPQASGWVPQLAHRHRRVNRRHPSPGCVGVEESAVPVVIGWGLPRPWLARVRAWLIFQKPLPHRGVCRTALVCGWRPYLAAGRGRSDSFRPSGESHGGAIPVRLPLAGSIRPRSGSSVTAVFLLIWIGSGTTGRPAQLTTK